MLAFFEQILWALVLVPVIFAGLFVIKFILANGIALFVSSYHITVSPEKTSAKNLKTGQVASIDNFFYTAFVPAKKSGLQEEVVVIGDVGKPEQELEAELKQLYVQFKKNTFYNSQKRMNDFWQVILAYFLIGQFKANLLTLLCGRHRIQFQNMTTEQQLESKKVIKAALRNARFIASHGHGIST